jgi:Glutamine amidotransferase domain
LSAWHRLNRTLSPERITCMRDTLKHRGPDDQGTWCSPIGRIALGHRRLSFMDLFAAGRQPLSDARGELQIIFNGEIYNYQELPLGLHWLDPGIIDFAFGRGPDAPRATPHQRKILPRKLAQRMLPSQTGTFAQAAVHALAESVARGRMERRLSNIYRLFALTMLELWRREYHSQLPSGA